ncbi:hypothetical protein PHYPSEUDO_015381 [Phytophthora pseudosyringae]|uniref:Cyclic nucleotide-binding domain-containing protein n=1 Tax=Phytophthora pseudosyringae TaxID=221518 RepID=A0A8T1VZZ3_9STRA|nr:hypothetical protein PHYPSEUDO_015381 [Phytophthora pseudosyringae]
MGSMKGLSSDTSASSRVVPEGETAIREASSTSPSHDTSEPLLANRASPIIPQDAAQASSADLVPAETTDQSIVLGPVLPEIGTPSGEANEQGADGNGVTREQARQANDSAIETIKAIEFTDETHTRRSWKVVGKLAVLAKSMNAHTIDIYHDRKLNTSRFMIHPNSKLRRAWEVLTVCLVLYVCVMIPFIIGFQFVDWGRLNGMNTFIDVYFIADMVMTLRTGIVSNGEVVMDPKRVARKYFRSWFIVDLISNFPLVLFVQSSGKSLKIVKLQKIPKLLRIGRLLKYLREYAKYYNLLVSFLGLAMGLHLFACLWASLFNECYDIGGHLICTEEELAPMYVQCIHTIMLMFLGIGETTTYSSIAKMQNPEMNANIELYYMSITVFMLGTVFSSFLFGNILALLMSWDQQKAQFRNRMDMIKTEMKYYELPEELQHRVRRNYDYLWINQRAYSDMMLLNQPGISKPLKTTIALHLYKDLLNTVPFFAGSDSRFLGKVCLALETAVYLPGDTIIYCDDIGKEMFIVRKGLVEILVPDPENAEKRIYLRDGNFFGETALVIDVRRTNTVRAVNICDLNVLSKHAFNEIAAEYPEFGERMKRTVIKRQLDNMNIQSPSEKAKVHNQLTLVVEKSLKQRRMSVSLRTIYRAKKLGDKLKDIADRASKPVRRLSRAVVPRQTRVRPSIREDSQRKTMIDAGDSTRDLAQFSRPVSGSSARSLFPKRPTITTRTSSGLPRQVTHPGATEPPAPRRTMDSVSRKLSRSELTLDLIPAALAEITTMVEQIRQTTELLSLRLGATDDLDDDEEDDEFDYDDNYSDDVPLNLRDSPPFPPLTEESDDEMARRESNSIFVPNANGNPTSRMFGDKRGSDPSSMPTAKDIPKKE